jgi:PAS domain S-box-containing protein
MPDHDGTDPLPMDAQSVAPVAQWEITEQLVLAGLRQLALTDQLQRQLALSRAIATSLTEGICTVDPSGHITFLNTAAERLLGWLDADVRGREAGTVLLEPIAGSAPEAFPPLAVLRSGLPYHTDYARFLRKDGTSLPVAYSAALMVVDDQIVGVVVAFNDVTEMQRLHHMQEEYLELVSHDLRTPLTAMIGYAQLLLKQLQEAALERAMRSAEAIATSGAMMERMIQDVLEHSRLQRDHVEVRLAQLDLVQLVARSLDQNLLPADRARIEVETVASLPVIADAIGMERVILNLVTNACKYSGPSSPVQVRVFSSDRDALIAVTDHGVGIDADELPHVFEKHYRARTARTTQGAGLGLFASRLIVEAHSGRIWAHSAVGHGSTFTVSIPATALPASANEV